MSSASEAFRRLASVGNDDQKPQKRNLFAGFIPSAAQRKIDIYGISEDVHDGLHRAIQFPDEIKETNNTVRLYRSNKELFGSYGITLPPVGIADNDEIFYQIHALPGYVNRDKSSTAATPRIVMRKNKAELSNDDTEVVLRHLASHGTKGRKRQKI